MTRRRSQNAPPALLDVSATGAAGARRAADHPEEWFPTPLSVTRALQRELLLPGGRWLEPCAGDGSLVRAFDHRAGDIVWDLVELRPEMGGPLARLPHAHVECCDYLTRRGPVVPYEVAIANPPFSLAARFVGKMLREARWVVVLLKLSFLASASRNAFMRRCTPDLFVLPQRPSFDGRGTDNAEYGWFVWPAGRRGSTVGWPRLVILPLEGPQQGDLLEDAKVVRLPRRSR